MKPAEASRAFLANNDEILYVAIVVLGEGDYAEGRRRLIARVPSNSRTVEFDSSADVGVDP